MSVKQTGNNLLGNPGYDEKTYQNRYPFETTSSMKSTSTPPMHICMNIMNVITPGSDT
ncbi:MAG: hypothetical protein R2741_15060 [Methanolobus sp.]